MISVWGDEASITPVTGVNAKSPEPSVTWGVTPVSYPPQPINDQNNLKKRQQLIPLHCFSKNVSSFHI